VPAPPYEKSVFINCPFDTAFEPLFHAIVLTVTALDFVPRCARETEGEADPRIFRIAKGLLQSKYSIHDLSRYQGEGAENLARFNMPLELGMALCIRYLGDTEQRVPGHKHNWLALVPPNFTHQRVISDLAGYDAPDHDQQPVTIIRRVASWLMKQPDYAEPVPTARAVFEAYPRFRERLEQKREEALGDLTWPAILNCADEVVAGMVL